MWNWLKKKFSRKEEQVMAVRQAARPKIMPPPHPHREMRGDITVSDIRIGDRPIEEFTGFRFSNPSPVFSFDTEREAVTPLPQDRVEVETPKYEPAPAREPVANFTYTEPASSYESSSSCDSSSYSSSDSGSSCSSD